MDMGIYHLFLGQRFDFVLVMYISEAACSVGDICLNVLMDSISLVRWNKMNGESIE